MIHPRSILNRGLGYGVLAMATMGFIVATVEPPVVAQPAVSGRRVAHITKRFWTGEAWITAESALLGSGVVVTSGVREVSTESAPQPSLGPPAAPPADRVVETQPEVSAFITHHGSATIAVDATTLAAGRAVHDGGIELIATTVLRASGSSYARQKQQINAAIMALISTMDD